MQKTTAIALVLGGWASLFLLDGFLKTSRIFSGRYMQFLTLTGFSIGIVNIRWYTTSLNLFFHRFGQSMPHFLKIWFNFGIVFGLCAVVFSIAVLVILLVKTFLSQPEDEQILVPVLPGVNLPFSQIGYYLVTLLLSGILHEIGHALAAVREHVPVNGFGIFLMAIYPGAFVDLSTEHLQNICPIRQLRIYCAGVWHNFVLVLLSISVLLTLPVLLYPFYVVNQSLVVLDVVPGSALAGSSGLVRGDQLTDLSGCKVSNHQAWRHCISQSTLSPSPGYCLQRKQLLSHDVATTFGRNANGVVECCGNSSNSHICFEYSSKSSELNYACLPARFTMEKEPCGLHSECHRSARQSVCVHPSLGNMTRLLRLNRVGRPPLLFLGYPIDLEYSAHLSSYAPRNNFISIGFPVMVETCCKYLISLSSALALLNVVPCYALDGQWILVAASRAFLRPIFSSAKSRDLFVDVVLKFGTSLLIFNIGIAMHKLFT